MLHQGVLLYLSFYIILNAESANILAIFHYPSPSHHLLGSALLKALAQRGHNVTMLSPFTTKNPPQNYTDVQLVDMISYKDENMKEVVGAQKKSIFKTMEIMIRSVQQTCVKFFENPATKFMLESDSKFDIIILNWALSESLTYFGHHFKAPIIAFSPIGASPYVNYLTGNNAPYAYVPNMALPYSDEMPFGQRLLNTLVGIAGIVSMELLFLPHQRKLLETYHPNSPSLEDLVDNVDLLLCNSHYSLETPRPYLPNMIPIGGFYMENTDTLPKDIETILNNSKNGVIFFSLGSNIKSSTLSQNDLKSILSAFSKLQYDVLWKFEDDNLEDKPKNVYIRSWLPQKGILAHPNTKVFITHGGLGSVTEAIYFGVPIIGIPFFGDQARNMNDAVSKGFAILVKSTEISEEILFDSITDILTNSTYSETVQRLSNFLRDQPLNAMDKAIYWVEHVIKYKGAKHLKAKASHLDWYQFFLLDVFAFISAVLLSILLLLYIFVKKLVCYFKRKNNSIEKKKIS